MVTFHIDWQVALANMRLYANGLLTGLLVGALLYRRYAGRWDVWRRW